MDVGVRGWEGLREMSRSWFPLPNAIVAYVVPQSGCHALMLNQILSIIISDRIAEGPDHELRLAADA